MFQLKKLDRLVINAFIGRFVVTFFVVLFVLLMQFFWLYMDDLLGKGLGTFLIFKLLFFMSATLIPLALPLAILLSSIMTFGSFGETFELVAVKASGISLFRFMRPLTILIIFISVGAFFFNNYAIPVANLKAYALLNDISKKPILNLKPGVFANNIGNFVIRIGAKDKDGESIHNVIIYDHSKGQIGNNVVIAKDGRMYTTPDKKYLIFSLKNGWRYEENIVKNEDRTQTRMHFDTWTRYIDISSFVMGKTDESNYKNSQNMMNVVQLQKNIDSFKRSRLRDMNTYAKNMSNYSIYTNPAKLDSVLSKPLPANKLMIYKKSFTDVMPKDKQSIAISDGTSSLQNLERISFVLANTQKANDQQDVRFKIEWHRKFVLSFAAILLFLIGAPLGGIIRKGGLGMPVLAAIILFVIYYIVSTTGEKLAKQQATSALIGMWVAAFVLIPIAIFILIKARNDSNLFNKDFYFKLKQKVTKWFLKNKSTNDLVDI